MIQEEKKMKTLNPVITGALCCSFVRTPSISHFFCVLHMHYYSVLYYIIRSIIRNIILYHVCLCVFFPSILDITFVGRTRRGHTGGRSHRIFNPPSFCGACLDFCREKDSAIPFPRRP